MGQFGADKAVKFLRPAVQIGNSLEDGGDGVPDFCFINQGVLLGFSQEPVKRTDSDRIEFIEITVKYAEEAHSFQQRHTFLFRRDENAFVKVKPG